MELDDSEEEMKIEEIVHMFLIFVWNDWVFKDWMKWREEKLTWAIRNLVGLKKWHEADEVEKALDFED